LSQNISITRKNSGNDFETTARKNINIAHRTMGSSATKLQQAAPKKGMVSFYSLCATKGDGAIQKMEDFRGKVIYATNVASK
jgi:hypothetical protein